ncbi:restriction endonuclease [Gordonia sputi]|uniref:Type III endonuclease n=1 Tax=Gordonia sputi NBRC 100414 TaxID=1089453 RepID=H5U6M7_9ACTN|nr:DEAD/DEAH box helicase family protein [Gordonia sputi]NKY94755.1 DEAD/DEAH box helicase family protein [Gordonia sputi]GAB41385.1 type III endonuclease [Gordonia sputi NBRC 100414]
MEFKFDAKQQYQLDAIGSLVQLFDGQPKDADDLVTKLRGSAPVEGTTNQSALDLDLTQEIGAVGNNLVLDGSTILHNLQAVQDKNGLEVLQELAGNSLDFDIEMETGTGKTYVYLRTIFELAKAYSFTKFVILVPSVAIKEGVTTSIKLMHQHFRELYPAHPFDYSVYSGKSAEEVQGFATSTNVQIMVMTIDSIRGDASSRIIHQNRDKLNGLRPIDYLKATHPVVIMDEPQNMESKLSQSSISELDPIATLRFSATHRKQRNVVYRLDPVDAHDHGLVKQIVVAEVAQQGTDAAPYIKVIEVKRDPWEAKLELAVRAADGSTPRRIIKVKQDQELSNLTNNPAYEGWWITELSIEPQYVDLNKHGMLQQGEEIGGNSDSIYREMIRETIREHLRKQTMLASKNIKVLSLFFIDKVENFLGDGVNNIDANGQFVQWFDELFREERAKSAQWQELFPQDPADLRRGYFSVLKGKKGMADKFQDTSGATKADDDAYDLIMRDKARLLDEAEPVRFIFSHSALREGWDNPNVFQICTLREMGAEVERRQTIGRGLRLPVDQTGERVADRSIAQLTVVANESYQAFAKKLQTEYEKSGVEIGRVRPQEFSKIPLYEEHIEPDGPEYFGYERSKTLYEALESSGMIKDGKITAAYQPTQLGFDLKQHVPDFYWPYEDVIIEYIARSSIERYVKPQSKRKARKLNKELFANPEFEEFWRTISRRTTYRVAVDRERLIEATVKVIKEAPPIQPLRIQVTRAGVKILRGGTKATETGQRSASLQGAYDLPDIITELQEATSLTRKTIIDILLDSGRLPEFIGNPNDFIQMVKGRLQSVLAEIVTEGIQYEKIGGYVYELRELQKDGQEEKDRFLDQMYKLQNPEKSDFDYVVYDSEPERQFAELLDGRDDVKLFMKLPSKFKIDTPVGPYNPDWAIIKHEAGQDRIYMIREIKSTDDEVKRRPTENAKIKAATKHFAAIGVGDYAVSVPGAWRV